MIYSELANEFRSLFKRLPDRKIALWFDEKREFERLLPGVEAYLRGLALQPFVLLRYDEAAGHGQLWIKHEIHWASRNLPVPQKEALRHVVYLPFPVERLDGPEEEGGWSADLLLEYRNLGAIWLIDGKKPTLFGFLRKAAVNLPTDPKEQRQLWDGGRDSLLAKFTARYADRDVRFWQQQLAPAWVREQVIGDVEQTILDLAAEPAEKLNELARDGLVSDFVQQVREAFGFFRPIALPDKADLNATTIVDEWLADFVLRLALVEAYAGYGEPGDFPYLELLPESPFRRHCIEFLKRWLKDTAAAGDYLRIIRRVERDYDLTTWARSRSGASFSFPHLARLRFQILYERFKAAAKQKTEYVALLHDVAKELATLADLSRASPERINGFDLLHRLTQLVPACENAAARARACISAEDVLRVYTESAGEVDRKHWRLIADCSKEADLEALIAVANRAYGEYAEALNDAFFDRLRDRKEWTFSGIRPISEVVSDIWSARSKRAVVIVDALRFDCATEIRDKRRLPEASLTPALACIPTRTWVGMTALLPLRDQQLRYEPGPGEGRLRSANTNANFSDRQARLQFLRDQVRAKCMEIEEVENEARAPKPLPDVLCIFGHETIDSLGHDKASDLIRHLDTEVERLGLVIDKLHRWGYPEVHLVTDHGFVTTSSEVEPTVVPIPVDRTIVAKSRYALVEEGTLIDAKTFPFPFDPHIRVAVPAGMAFFKSEKTFSHGGVSLQEVVIPHLASRRETMVTRVGLQVVPAAYEIKTYSVKVVLDPMMPEKMDLFTKPVGRTVEVDLMRGKETVVAHAVQKEIKPEAGQRVTVVLMLNDKLAFMEGEMLDLIVRDVETREVVSPAGLRLTIARSLKP
jgi:hypothetical protein